LASLIDSARNRALRHAAKTLFSRHGIC